MRCGIVTAKLDREDRTVGRHILDHMTEELLGKTGEVLPFDNVFGVLELNDG
jgi:hypothetical protein